MITTLQCPRCGGAYDVLASGSSESLCCCGVQVDPSSIVPDVTSTSGPEDDTAAAPPSPTPTLVGDYLLVERIGGGGSGEVYRGHPKDEPSREVAVRLASPVMRQDPERRARFEKEARVARSIRHQAIAEVYESGADDSGSYIVTEFIAGRSLREVLRGGPLDPERAARIALDVAEALARFHAAGEVHRGVKPSNVMIGDDGRVKLIDFGLAETDGPDPARAGSPTDTPAYLAPERLPGRARDVGPASDQYGLGVILYEMLCGRTPFRGEPDAVLRQVISSPVPPMAEHGVDVPPDLEKICRVALARDPKDRHGHCRDFANALRCWLDDRTPRDRVPEPAPVAASHMPSYRSVNMPKTPRGDELHGRDTLRELIRLSNDCAAEEERARNTLDQGLAAAKAGFERRKKALIAKFEDAREEKRLAEKGMRRSRDDASAKQLADATRRYQEKLDLIDKKSSDLIQSKLEQYKDRAWLVESVFEAKCNSAKTRGEAALVRLREASEERAQMKARLGHECGRLRLELPDLRTRKLKKEATERELTQRLSDARQALEAIESHPSASSINWPLGARPDGMATRALVRSIGVNLGVAKGLIRSLKKRAEAYLPRRIQQLEGLRADKLALYDRKAEDFVKEVKANRERLNLAAQQRYKQDCQAARAADEAERAAAELAALERSHRAEVQRAEAEHGNSVGSLRGEYDAAIADLASRLRRGIAAVVAAVGRLREAADRCEPRWDDWSPPEVAPPAVRLGTLLVRPESIRSRLPATPALREVLPEELAWPAMLGLDAGANLLIEAPAAQRPAAGRLVHAVVLRLLASLPPGLLRLTLIDPVGRGSEFPMVRRQAGQGELVEPICTSPAEIERSLDVLRGHAEKIIQGYLGDETPTIREFNASSGAMAEPYRVVVVCDYPKNFDEASSERLAWLVQHGARCGVITIVLTNPDQDGPAVAGPLELARYAMRLSYRDGGLVWADPDFDRFPLEVEPPLDPTLATDLVRRVSRAGTAAQRAEVAFESVAPTADRWWSADSRGGIEVGLGMAGPGVVQSLEIGRGKAQHIVLAGHAGSGKSSLLHALIVNLALSYGPDELELYLVGFKKGGEFRAYAAHGLPHARVIGIESEREFGLGVLRRLDAVLKKRGDQFRTAGVDNLHDYRGLSGLPPLPRTLLIVDEFQELFAGDDEIAREASLLLDRLVRQGPASGVHVLLCSRTLVDAHPLSRTKPGRMAVRIALQCGADDANLILDEDNDAVRLLTRPGQAIYNAANGRAGGNHFFQVAWLSGDRRDDSLARIRDLARDRGWHPLEPPVIFEGDAPSRLPANARLQARIEAPDWPSRPRSATAWLGEAIAVKDPTAVGFRARQRSHLLIVGQDAEAARGMLGASLLSLAAQHHPSSAGFFIAAGRADAASARVGLAEIAEVLPQITKTYGPDEAGSVVVQLAREIQRRAAEGSPDDPDLFLFLFDLNRLRSLRRSGDDHARASDPSCPSSALEAILRDGPAAGVHVLAWCDTVAHLNHALGRDAVEEFGTRVALRMSDTDASLLLGVPDAIHPGPNRALFFDEDRPQIEKFRPYGPPPHDWLAEVGERFRRRGPY